MPKKPKLTKIKSSKLKTPSFKEKPKMELKLSDIQPKTEKQQITFEHYHKGKNFCLHGMAGTGKTFMAMYLSLNEILSKNSKARRIIVIRSVVPTRDIGFLPGSIEEKTNVYEMPYSNICTELFINKNAYEDLKEAGKIEFATTSFVRGLTFENAIVIVDECQNMTFHELDSIITRSGNNCRLLFCGDFNQSDLGRKSGITEFMDVLYKMKSFCMIEFDQNDIVRSGLVREYILAKNNLPDEYTEFWRDSTDHYEEQFEEQIEEEQEESQSFLDKIKLF